MWRRIERSCTALTMSTRHCFTPSSPDYPNLGQLDGQQCNSARVHPYAYPQHMNMLKHFLYIQYGCGEEVSGVVQPQPCQHIIISPHHPQITTQICVNFASSNSVRMHPYAQILSVYTRWMWRRSEESCSALTMSTCHYLFDMMTILITSRMTTMT